MSFTRLRKLMVLALLAAGAYWVYRTRPTVSGFVDDLTRPIFRTRAVVDESEHKRVVAEAAPLVEGDEAVAVGMLREKMTGSEVRDLVGPPDTIEQLREDGEDRTRWTYRRLGRILIFQDGRVTSIAVR